MPGDDDALAPALLDAAPDPTVVVGAAGEVLLASRRVHEVLGWSRDELVGRPVDVLVPERFHAAHPLRPGPSAVGTLRFPVLHRDGREVPAELSVATLEGGSGPIVSVAIRDLTERARVEAAADRMRDELIATVSHELRTPLTSIIGYTELLADLGEDELGPTARGLVRVIERNAAREMRLVDDLLTMAFLDDDQLRIEPETLDLGALARRVVHDQQRAAVEAGVRLVLDADEVRPVPGDAHRLAQVLENLLTNAFKFTPAGGEVRVHVGPEDGRAVLAVADSGVGLHAGEEAHIFDRLYRTPSAVAAHAQGAGLGLSIVRKIVEAHRGEVSVDSTLGVGTTFRVALPYAG